MKLTIVLIILLAFSVVSAQTNTFTYQGKLTDMSMAANGTYDFQFSLFDSGNGQIGSTVTLTNVTVMNGVFTVDLSFGNGAFNGDRRFLQISVKKTTEPGYTPLTPRQEIKSSPYSIQTFNALRLEGLAATDFLKNTTTQQSANFNISGNGTVGGNLTVNGTLSMSIVNASTQFNIGGNRFISQFSDSTAVGLNTGTTGGSSAYFGSSSGASNTSGGFNNFFGAASGFSNTTGSENSFFGANTGAFNTSGMRNSFFGTQAGTSNTIGSNNTLLGYGANVGTGNLNYATAIGAGAIVSNSDSVVLGRNIDLVRIPGSLLTTGSITGSQYSIGTQRVLSIPGTENLFVGVGSGMGNAGSGNTFIGFNAGKNNTNSLNTFVGNKAGENNTSGGYNSFFGHEAGKNNTTGSFNSFFGESAGLGNTTGTYNSFFGITAGSNNTTGQYNSYFGNRAGFTNQTGDDNSFFGNQAGTNNTASGNSFFGRSAGSSNTIGDFNSFFGFAAGSDNLSGSSNSFFGSDSGKNTTTGNRNVFFGNSAGFSNTTGENNTFIGVTAGNVNTTGTNNTVIGYSANLGSINLSYATAIGAGATVSTSSTIALGRSSGLDRVVIYGLGSAGSTTLCRNASNQISTCSSSLRYKENIQQFNNGLNLVRRLNPITFDWKDGGTRDLGLGAEDVAAVEPLLVTYNEKGEVEGVKYDRIGVVLLNAVKEQQAQIEAQEKENQALKTQVENQQKQIETQQKQLDEQKTMIENLRLAVCSQNPNSLVCKTKEENPNEK